MPRLAETSRHELIARWFFLLIGIGVVVLFWKIIQPFALVLLTAGIGAVLFTPFERRLRRLVRSPRLSSALTVALVLFAIVAPLFTIGFVMVKQAADVAPAVAAWLKNFDVATVPVYDLLPVIVREQLAAINLEAAISAIAQWAPSHLRDIFASSAQFLFNTFIFFVCLFFFLLDRERILGEMLALSPFKDKTDNTILARMTKTIRAVVLGSLIVALVQGIIAGIGMTIFGVPGALIWAGLVVIAAQVPMVGTAAVLTPVCIYMFLSGDTVNAIGLSIWSALAVGMIDNLLGPYLVEGKTRMHALLILLSVLGGLQLFGPIGFIIGPTALAALLALLEMYKAGVLEKHNL